MSTLLIDNYDSFTWNVYQYLCELGASVIVERNDAISLEKAIKLNPKNIVISPGPGHPKDAAISNDIIRYFAGKVPILGVCLGEQCMFELFGGTVCYAGELIHGKTSPVFHDGTGLFEGVPQGIECTRYHSLAGDPSTLPESLQVTCKTSNGIIMGVRHKTFVIEGVQFHPESIASESGYKIFANFLSWVGGTWQTLKRDQAVFDIYQQLRTKESQNAVGKMNSTGNDSSILNLIAQQRITDVQETQRLPGKSFQNIKKSLAISAPTVLSFVKRLEKQRAVLAEIKRASPSKGSIGMNVHAPSQALIYAQGGASAISVLTEPKWFKGSLDDMLAVRLALDKLPNRPAVLRKDFIVDPYQIYEARLYGADTILLIVAILTDAQLTEFISISRSLGMEPLVEVANEQEMYRAMQVGAQVIGVNNRDLHTFQMDMDRSNRIASMGKDCILLALSGITGVQDIQSYLDANIRGFLVGEALMKADNPIDLIHSLRGVSIKKRSLRKPIIKMCGMKTLKDVQFAMSLNVDLIGFIFEKSSSRYIEPEAVKSILSSINPETTMPGIKGLATRTMFVGVFTHHSVQEMNEIAEFCNLDWIQFHGSISPEMAMLVKKPVIQAATVEQLLEPGYEDYLIQCGVSMVLVDASEQGKLSGGTGKTVDWQRVPKLELPLLLAGGLNPTNVKEAVDQVQPFGVDVSSGIETNKQKDHTLMQAFIKDFPV